MFLPKNDLNLFRLVFHHDPTSASFQSNQNGSDDLFVASSPNIFRSHKHSPRKNDVEPRFSHTSSKFFRRFQRQPTQRTATTTSTVTTMTAAATTNNEMPPKNVLNPFVRPFSQFLPPCGSSSNRWRGNALSRNLISIFSSKTKFRECLLRKNRLSLRKKKLISGPNS